LSVARGPILADSLRAALLARVPSLEASVVPRDAFVTAAGACDAADRAYRAFISANLADADAREILAATNAYRARVRTVRANAVLEGARIARDAANEPYDPLDVVTPRIANLSQRFERRRTRASDPCLPPLCAKR
jgi:hypothetical protein